MKFNWRSFMFSMGVLLFALIAVNLISSGVKMEGFQEGATPLEDQCSKALPNDKKKTVKISDLKKDIDDKKKDVWKDANNIDYVKKLPAHAPYKGNCDAFIKEYAKPAAAAKPAPVPAKPVPVPAKPAAKPAPVPAKPAAKK